MWLCSAGAGRCSNLKIKLKCQSSQRCLFAEQEFTPRCNWKVSPCLPLEPSPAGVEQGLGLCFFSCRVVWGFEIPNFRCGWLEMLPVDRSCPSDVPGSFVSVRVAIHGSVSGDYWEERDFPESGLQPNKESVALLLFGNIFAFL